MPYQDPPTKSKHVAWFVVLAILMLGWNFWLPELRNHEAMIGVTARELLANGHPLALTYHGEPSSLWPLVTWLVSVVGLIVDPDISAARRRLDCPICSEPWRWDGSPGGKAGGWAVARLPG